MDKLIEIKDKLEKYKPYDKELLDCWLLRVHKIADELFQKDMPYLLSQLAEARKEIEQLKEELAHYAKADYKGEYNDVDGGYSARLLLARLNNTPKEVIEKMEKDHNNRW